MDLFSRNISERSVCLEVSKIESNIPKRREIKRRLLKGDGDFRSKECIDILEKADIVVTNPPFSLFNEYVLQLVKYNKQFLIIGNQNAMTNKEIFPLIKNNQIWHGYHVGDMKFKVPSYYEPRATRYWEDEGGQKWRSLGNICWLTNLDIKKRHECDPLYREYDPKNYPKYDNFDAIEISQVRDMPCDYAGFMGVPLTFLSKYSPDYFEIIGSDIEVLKEQNDARGRFYVNGERKYARIVVRNKKPGKRT